jgi:hypothetical protein
MRRTIEYGATKKEVFEAITAAAVPGGGVAYRAGIRALHALEQDGAFAPPSPPPPARRQRGKATHFPRVSHTALAGHCRPAVPVPDRSRPAGGCPAWHLSLGGCRLPETRGACAPARFLAVCRTAAVWHRCAVASPSAAERRLAAGGWACTLTTGARCVPIGVGTLACTTTAQDLRQRFEPSGTVDTVRRMTDRAIGRSRSCQFLAQNTHPHTTVKERGKALLERSCERVKG